MAGGRMKVAGAIAVGYLLGRTHKMGLTLGVTGWVIRRLASPQVVRSLVTGPITTRANRLANALSQRTAVLEQARAGAGAVEQAASQATTASGGQRQGEEPQSAQPGGEGPQGEAAAVQPEQGGRGPRRPESAGRQVEDTRRPTAR